MNRNNPQQYLEIPLDTWVDDTHMFKKLIFISVVSWPLSNRRGWQVWGFVSDAVAVGEALQDALGQAAMAVSKNVQTSMWLLYRVITSSSEFVTSSISLFLINHHKHTHTDLVSATSSFIHYFSVEKVDGRSVIIKIVFSLFSRFHRIQRRCDLFFF